MTGSYSMLAKQMIDNALISDLYAQFVKQLQKDLNRGGVDYVIQNKDPQKLYYEIVDLLSEKLQYDSGQFSSLLYAVDVSETSILKFEPENRSSIAEYITYLIFKREWQKVCYRNDNKIN